jgi:hypothetical protein
MVFQMRMLLQLRKSPSIPITLDIPITQTERSIVEGTKFTSIMMARFVLAAALRATPTNNEIKKDSDWADKR